MTAQENTKQIELTKPKNKAREMDKQRENDRQKRLLDSINSMRAVGDATLFNQIQGLKITPIRVSDQDQSDDQNKEFRKIQTKKDQKTSPEYKITIPKELLSSEDECSTYEVTTDASGNITGACAHIDYSDNNKDNYIKAQTNAMNMTGGLVKLSAGKPLPIDEAKAMFKAYKETKAYKDMNPKNDIAVEKTCVNIFFSNTIILDKDKEVIKYAGNEENAKITDELLTQLKSDDDQTLGNEGPEVTTTAPTNSIQYHQ
jgi:hypothetical protein